MSATATATLDAPIKTAKPSKDGETEVKEEQSAMDAKNKASADERAAQERDAKNAAQARKKQLVEELEAARDRAAKSIGRLEDGTALSFYLEVGADCFDAIYRAWMIHSESCQDRKVPNTWKDADYDNQCNILATRYETFFPHVFLSKDDEGRKSGKRGVVARVSHYVAAFRSIEKVKKDLPYIADAVDGLSWHLVINQVVRKMVSYSKLTLDCEIRPDWSEFLKTNVPRIASGSIVSGDFLALVKEHENKLKAAKLQESNPGKTPAEVAQIESDEAEKKKARKASEATTKAKDDLATSLDNALSGVLDAETVGKVVTQIASDRKIDLASLGIATEVKASQGFDPLTVTADQVLDLFRGMFMAGREKEIRAIHAVCSEMVARLDAISVLPTLKAAG